MTCCESNDFVKEPIVRQWKWRDLMNCKGDQGFERSEFEIIGEGREGIKLLQGSLYLWP